MRLKKIMYRVATAVVLIGIIVLFRALPVSEWLLQVESWAGDHPVAAPLAYVAVTFVSVVALTPGWIPMSLAGLFFGFGPGLLYGSLATTAGAAAALVLGRTLARGWVEKRIAGSNILLALDDALDDQAFTIVALTRLALVIPFNILNYAYGLTRVRLPVFVAATAVGMLPIVALYAYLGSIAQDLGDILSGNAQIDVGFAWIAGVAAVVIAIVIFIVRRAVRRALSKETDTESEIDKTAI